MGGGGLPQASTSSIPRPYEPPMATLLLRSAGSAVGTLLGGPLGGLIGGAIGAVGGAVVDNLLANALVSRPKTPQLDTIAITSSNEGAPVRKLWGRMRLGGNVIWTTQFQTFDTDAPGSSGKGSGNNAKVTHYTLSYAVAFCEGGDDVTLGRVWADGAELDLGQYGYAFYNGSESQLPDSWIESVEGTGAVPAYRGLCYLVFQDMALDAFGNRMPQITAELIRRPPIPDPDDLTNLLRSVAMLPGAGEFVLGTEVYQSSDGFGAWYPENVHTPNGATDFSASLGQLEDALPNCSAVSLVVSWFGTDLRAGACQIVPKVETNSKTVTPADWAVAGFTRASAAVVSQIDPSTLDPTGLVDTAPITGLVPAFGGTPSDDTVIQAIVAMNTDGLRVMFYPFVMMDIPVGNGLPDPYGGTEQAAFPWRGRITCFPAPGQAGSPDKTAEAATEINAFFAQYSTMVLHYAQLCVSAGGVDSFVIGSELVGLTRVRSSAGDGTYPAVQALKTLAAEVKAIVGAGCQGRLCGRLERIPFAPARRRLGRRHLQHGPAVVRPEHRLRRHRQLPADERLARRRAQRRLRSGRRALHDLRQELSRPERRGRRGLRLVLRLAMPIASPRPARRSSTRRTASIGCSARRTSATGG